MPDAINHRPARPSLLDMVERSSLLAILQQALADEREPRLRPAPAALDDDLIAAASRERRG